MTSRFRLGSAVLLLGAAACSKLSGDPGVPVALEVLVPSATQVEVGDTIQLAARALNQQGDSVAATIVWRTPDTLVLAIDSLTGRLTGRSAGTGRVQARTGTLVSSLVTFTSLARVDTLQIIPPDSSRVAAGASSSDPLVVELDSLNPLSPVASRQVIYQVVLPLFGQPGDTVALTGGGLTATATTGADGRPISPVTLNRVTGQASPDSAQVEVRSERPSGALVPGSGQRFIVRFD